MSSHVDRARIKALLQEPELSFRAIARDVGCSDWTVREVYKELDGDPPPLQHDWRRMHEPHPVGSEITGWIGLAGAVGFFGLVLWFGFRGMPPET